MALILVSLSGIKNPRRFEGVLYLANVFERRRHGLMRLLDLFALRQSSTKREKKLCIPIDSTYSLEKLPTLFQGAFVSFFFLYLFV